MDFGIIGGVNPPDPKAGGPLAFDNFESARFAMGDTIRYAQWMGLIEMTPRRDLSSTGYFLAHPGVEYLVLQPTSMEGFTVTLEPGTYSVEWFAVDLHRLERSFPSPAEVAAQRSENLRGAWGPLFVSGTSGVELVEESPDGPVDLVADRPHLCSRGCK
jgi:hypothetical protein